MLFSDLVLSCQLWTYLADINEQAQDRLQILISQMQKAESVTEKMKEDNQWEWIQRMNSIHNRAEEIVVSELIYKQKEKEAYPPILISEIILKKTMLRDMLILSKSAKTSQYFLC